MKTLVKLLTICLLVSFIVGCGSTPTATQAPSKAAPATSAPATSAPATSAPATSAPATSAPAASSQKVKIVYWSMFTQGEPLQQVLDQATKDFMAANPNIEVDIKWDGRTVLTDLQPALAAGTQIDITDQSDSSDMSSIVANGQALPLNKYLAEPSYDGTTTWQASFNPGVLDIGKDSTGNYYLIPREDYISAFFYNKGMLDSMGIQPQMQGMTWDQFTSMLDTIRSKSPTVSPLGADGNVSSYNDWYFSYLAIRLAGEDAFLAAAHDKTGAAWGAPEFLQAAQMIKDLQTKNYFQKNYGGSVWPAAQQLWVNSKIAMIFCGAWLPTEMSQQMPQGFSVGMFEFPTVPNGKGNNLVEHWANAYVVLKATKNPEAVARYLKYIMSMPVATKIVALGSPVPLVGAPVPPALANQYKILAASTTMPARAGLEITDAKYVTNVLDKCDDQLFQGTAGPAQFVTCMETGTKSYWGQ